jgi:hypothetical protein
MGKELAVIGERAEQILSSPDLRELRRIPLGTVVWPGKPTRRYLAGGSTLTPEVQARAERMRAEISAALDCASLPEATGARLAIVVGMLMAYPMAGANAETGSARAAAYRDALDDVPPWAVQHAVRSWHRGECAGNHDFAPSPARLRELCMTIVEQYREALRDVTALLSVWTFDDAMDPEKEPPTRPEIGPGVTIPRLRSV